MASVEELKQAFESVDEDKSGEIDAGELQLALEKNGLHFDLPLCRKLCQFVDLDGNGEVSFAEYAKLHNFLIRVSVAYAEADIHGTCDGVLTFGEAYTATTATGLTVPLTLFDDTFHFFDQDDNRKLKYDEFVAMELFFHTVYEEYQKQDSPAASFEAVLADALNTAKEQEKEMAKESHLPAYRSWKTSTAAATWGVLVGMASAALLALSLKL